MTINNLLWSDTDQIKYISNTTDQSLTICFGKIAFDSVEKHRKHSTHIQMGSFPFGMIS